MSKIIISTLVIAIKYYQILISPYIGKNCRFYPNCSNYTLEAIKIYQKYGIILGLNRIFRCHPFGKFGYDPVPKKKLEI